MKKLLIILCAVILFSGMNLQAAPVSSSRAMDIAKKIFAAQPATKSGTGELKIIWDGEEIATKAAQPAFYVITRDGGGFVIIAGDDNVQPVLAISDHNDFKVEGMPEHVRWWMERMKAYVRVSTEQSPEIKSQWSMYMATKIDNARITGTVTDKVEKLTPEWDQGNNDPTYFGTDKYVFNAKCPIDKDGETRSLTGCVAIALAELLTYQSGQAGVVMPTSATGTVGGYTPSTGCVAPAAYSLGTVYDWANLRTLTNIAAVKSAVDANNTTLLNNLAQLIADLGAMVKADYSKNSTSAVTAYAIEALINHMGFNKSAYYAAASNYSSHQWIELLKSELNKRPLIYNGRTSGDAGHAFIFDGYGKYNGADVFHVNFGWGGGDYNGYYYHTNLDSGNGNYSYQCGAIIDFYPNSSSTYPIKLEAYYDPEDANYPGVKVTHDGTGYLLSYYIVNRGLQAYSGQVKFSIKKKNVDDPTEIATSTRTITSLNPNHITGEKFGYVSLGDFSFGDKVICFYKDGDDWVQLSAPTGTAVTEWPLVPTAFIKTKASYSQNEWFPFELMNNDYRYAGTVWTITDPQGITQVKNQSDYEVQLTKTGTYKIEAATAKTDGGSVIETIVTYINVE